MSKEYFYCTSHDGLKYRAEHVSGSVFNFTNLTKKAELNVKLCERFKKLATCPNNSDSAIAYVDPDHYKDPTGESLKFMYTESDVGTKEIWRDPEWTNDHMTVEWFCLEMKEKVAKIIQENQNKKKRKYKD